MPAKKHERRLRLLPAGIEAEMESSQVQNLFRKTTLLATFLLPIAYLSQILAVAIHEVGHGLATIAVGGTFRGFMLDWDGMGRAFTTLPPRASVGEEMISLAAGVVATTGVGLVLLLSALLARRRVAVRLTLLVLAFSCLMEGIPYVLWNSYQPVPPGDIGRILELWPRAGWGDAGTARYIMMGVSGVAFIATTFLLCMLLLQAIEQALLPGGRLSRPARFWALLCFLVIPAGAVWFLFDWNQLAPGIGWLPCYTGAGSVVASAVILFWFPLRPNAEIAAMAFSARVGVMPWACLAVVTVLMVFWLRHGIGWA